MVCRCNNQRAAEVADDRQRIVIFFTYVGVVAGRDRSNRGIEILHLLTWAKPRIGGGNWLQRYGTEAFPLSRDSGSR